MEEIIEVKEEQLEEVLKVHRNVIEFDESNLPKDFFESRYKDLEHIIILAYYNKRPIGYIIGYDDSNNSKSTFYCWLAGVDYQYRRKGALTALMNYLYTWSKENGYKKLRIKTRNRYKEMLSYLVKNNWNFLSVEEKGTIEDYRINLEKTL